MMKYPDEMCFEVAAGVTVSLHDEVLVKNDWHEDNQNHKP